MPKIRLTEEDAERYGVPRDVEFDETRLMGREAIAMSKIGWTLERLSAATTGTPVLDGDGNVMYERDEHGEVITKGGKPVFMLSTDPEALLVMAWLAVRRAKGTDVPWSDFDVNLRAFAESDDEPAGKAGTSTRTSRTATKSTRRR